MGLAYILRSDGLGNRLEGSGSLVLCEKPAEVLVHSLAFAEHAWYSSHNLSLHVLQNSVFERAWKDAKERVTEKKEKVEHKSLSVLLSIMEKYVSKLGLGKIIVYSAEELPTSYAKYIRRDVSEGFVVLVLPDPKLGTTTRQISYFFNDAKSEEEAMGRFLPRAYEDAEGKKWLKLLKTIEFH